jgi:hypothetical protein
MKFKIGDKIKHNYSGIEYKILNILELCYQLESSITNVFWIENEFIDNHYSLISNLKLKIGDFVKSRINSKFKFQIVEINENKVKIKDLNDLQECTMHIDTIINNYDIVSHFENNSNNQETIYNKPFHICQFNDYLGLSESFKWCNCGKKVYN